MVHSSDPPPRNTAPPQDSGSTLPSCREQDAAMGSQLSCSLGIALGQREPPQLGAACMHWLVNVGPPSLPQGEVILKGHCRSRAPCEMCWGLCHGCIRAELPLSSSISFSPQHLTDVGASQQPDYMRTIFSLFPREPNPRTLWCKNSTVRNLSRENK